MKAKYVTVKTNGFGKEFKHPNNNGKLLSNTQILTSSQYVKASNDKEINRLVKADKLNGLYINEYDAIIINNEPASKKDISAAKWWGRSVRDEVNAKRQTAVVHEAIHKIIRGKPEDIFSKQLNIKEIQKGINIELEKEGDKKWPQKKFDRWTKTSVVEAKRKNMNRNNYVGEELLALKGELNPKAMFYNPTRWYEKDIKKEIDKKSTHDRLFKPTTIKIKQET